MDDIPYNPTATREQTSGDRNLDDIPFNNPLSGIGTSQRAAENGQTVNTPRPTTTAGQQAVHSRLPGGNLSPIITSMPLDLEPDRSILTGIFNSNLRHTNDPNPTVSSSGPVRPQQSRTDEPNDNIPLPVLIRLLQRYFDPNGGPTRRRNAESAVDGNLADDEGSDPKPQPKRQTRRLQKPFYHPGYKGKEPILNARKEAIREYFKRLLKIKDRDPLPSPPSDFEIQCFEHGRQGSGPTIQDYTIHYKGAPSSKWNAHASSIFLDTFLHTARAKELFTDERERDERPLSENVLGDIAEKKRKLIQKMWVTHFRALRARYKRQERDRSDPLGRDMRNEQSNRARRRQTLFYRRLEIARANPEFHPHIKILRQFGPAGMSSDDSAIEEGNRVYTVFTRRWMNSSIRMFFRRLDEAYLRSRQTDLGRYTPGNLPHRRIRPPDGTHISTRYAVPFLPINLYNSVWYQSLSREDRVALKALPTEYDITFSPPAAVA